jgi:nucleotide-binding universal stress UspA family protein
MWAGAGACRFGRAPQTKAFAMSCQDVLVHIEAAAPRARYEIAAALAARGGGRLTGLYLKTSLINQFNDISALGYMPPGELDRLIRDHNQGQDEDMATAASVLAGLAARAKVECACRSINGDTPQELIVEARRADLVVMGPPSASPAYNVHASAVEVALGAGGPVLIVPAEFDLDRSGAGSGARIGGHALVAWNGGREAARALRDALPLLPDKAIVEVRVAYAKDEVFDTSPLRRHIELHGCRPNIETVVEDGCSVSEWLANEALRTGCDLIVMGLYGHPRLQEFVLGGVSRELVHRSPLPLLISH